MGLTTLNSVVGGYSRIFVLAVFGISLSNSNAAELNPGQFQYQAEGKLVYLVGDDQTPKFTRDFRLAVNNGDWEIRVTPDEDKIVDFFNVVHLSNSIYYYTSMGKLSSVGNFANNGTAVINYGDVPLEKGSFSSFIWLGLASSYYFQHSANQEVQPIWSGHDIINTKVKAQWELFEAPPFLPRKVLYYRTIHGMPPVFKNGWKAAEFRVLAETNVGNLTIPIEFIYEQFRPRTNAVKVDDIDIQLTVKVIVKSVQLLPITISPPITHGTTLIEDGRFEQHPELTVEYASTNNQLATIPLTAVIAQHEKLAIIADGEKLQAPVSSGKARVFILSFFALSAVGFVMMLIKTNKKTNKNN